MCSQNWRIFLLLPFMIIQINGYKVLFIAPGKAKSHFIFVSPFVRALLNRGHEVTYLTSNSLNLNLKNYTEVLLDDVPKTIGTSNAQPSIYVYSFMFNSILHWIPLHLKFLRTNSLNISASPCLRQSIPWIVWQDFEIRSYLKVKYLKNLRNKLDYNSTF